MHREKFFSQFSGDRRTLRGQRDNDDGAKKVYDREGRRERTKQGEGGELRRRRGSMIERWGNRGVV